MYSFCRALKVDLRRGLVSSSFLLTVALLFVVHLCAVLPDYFSQAIPKMSWQKMLVNAHASGLTDTMMFLGAVCYAWSYCQDRDSGFYDQAVRRVGFRVYCLSRVVAVALTAFLAGVLSDILLTLVLRALPELPPLSSHAAVEQALYLSVAGAHTGLFLLLRYVHTGMVCAMVGATGLAASAFVRNTHVAVFVPYVLYLLADELIALLKIRFFSFYGLFYFPHFRFDQTRSFWYMLYVSAVLIGIAGYVFYRRADWRR